MVLDKDAGYGLCSIAAGMDTIWRQCMIGRKSNTIFTRWIKFAYQIKVTTIGYHIILSEEIHT